MPTVTTNSNVEERIVEMRIDNQKFEVGAKKTISLLEDLDKNLNSLGKNSGDGLERINDSLDKVTDRFSVMGIVGDQVIRNLTNKAMDLIGQIGHLSKSLSIDQISAGWGKYAEKTSAVQTIMAATRDEFSDEVEQMKYVNDQLARLNRFTDETSYSLMDMTNNIGKFTAQGVNLEDSVVAMEGIANWAAVSGAGVSGASRAMYNLSQALGTGAVTTIDWRSIENANMATKEFKQTAIDTAVELGKLTKTAEGYLTSDGNLFTVESFRDQLKDKWFDKEVLMGTMDKYGSAAERIMEIADSEDVLVTSFLRWMKAWQKGGKEWEKVLAKEGDDAESLIPYFEELSAAEYELGLRAFRAAQEAKTFPEVLDATKDAVSTSWLNLFQKLFGTYLEAKEFWTDVAESLYDIFAEPVNKLNDLFAWGFGKEGVEGSAGSLEKILSDAGKNMGDLERALAKVGGNKFGMAIAQAGSLDEALRQGLIDAETFDKALREIGAGGSTEQVARPVEDSIEELREVALGILRGDYGAGSERKELLESMGYDYEMMQWIAGQMSNGHYDADILGLMKQWRPDYLEKVMAMTTEVNSGFEDTEKLLQGIVDGTISLNELGYEDIREAMEEDLGGVIELLNEGYLTISQLRGAMSGGELFRGTLTNILTIITDIMDAVGRAFNLVFYGVEKLEDEDLEYRGNGIYLFLLKIYSITSKLTDPDNGALSIIQGLFTGIFRVVKMIAGVIGVVFKAVGSVLGFVVSTVIEFFETLNKDRALTILGTALENIFMALLLPISLLIDGFKKMVESGKKLSQQKWAQDLSKWLKEIASKVLVFSWGLTSFMKQIPEWISNVAAAIKKSPIIEFFTRIGTVIRHGFERGGLKGAFKTLKRELPRIVEGTGISDYFKNIGANIREAGSSFSTWLSGFTIVQKVQGALGRIKEFFVSLFTLVKGGWEDGGIIGVFTALYNRIKELVADNPVLNFVFGLVTRAVEKIRGVFETVREALSGLGELNFFKYGVSENVWEVIELIRSLLIPGGLFVLMSRSGGFVEAAKDTLEAIVGILKPDVKLPTFSKFTAFTLGILELCGGVLILCFAVKQLADIKNTDNLGRAWAMVVVILGELAGSAALFKAIGNVKIKGLLQFSLAVALIAYTIKSLSELTKEQLSNGVWAIADIMAIMLVFTRGMGVVEKGSKRGMGGLIAFAVAVGILALIVKLLSNMPWAEFMNGFAKLLLIVYSMNTVIRSFGNVKTKAFAGFIGLGITVWLFAQTISFLGKMPIGRFLKGWLGLVLIINQVIRFTQNMGRIKYKGVGELIVVAIAIGIFANILKGLGRMPFKNILKGLIALWGIVEIIIGFTRRAFTITLGGVWKLIFLAITVGLFATTLAFLGMLSFKSIVKGLIGLFAIVEMLTLFTRRSKKVDLKSMVGLLVVSVTVILLAQTLRSLSRLSLGRIVKGLIGLFGILASLMLFMKIVSNTRMTKAKFVGIVLAVASIWAIAKILKDLTAYNWKKLAANAIILIVSLFGLVGSLVLLSKIKIGFKSILALSLMLIVGVGAMAAIGYVLAQLSDYNWIKMAGVAAVLVVTLFAICGGIVLLGKLPFAQVLKGAVLLGAILIILEVFVGAMLLLGAGIAKLLTNSGFGETISSFAKSLEPFLETVRNISEEDKEAVSRFSQIMLLILKAEWYSLIAEALQNIRIEGKETFMQDVTEIAGQLEGLLEKLRTIKETDIVSVILFNNILRILLKAEWYSLIAEAFQNLRADFKQTFMEDMTEIAGQLEGLLEKLRTIKETDIVSVILFNNILRILLKAEWYSLIAEALQNIRIEGKETFMQDLVDIAQGLNSVLDSIRLIKETDYTAVFNFNRILKNLLGAEWYSLIGEGIQNIKIEGKETFMQDLKNVATDLNSLLDVVRLIKDSDYTAVFNFNRILKNLLNAEWTNFLGEAIDNITISGKVTFIQSMADLARELNPYLLASRLVPVTSADVKNAENITTLLEALLTVSVWEALGTVVTAVKDKIDGKNDFLFIDSMTSLANKLKTGENNTGLLGALKDLKIPSGTEDKITSLAGIMKGLASISGWDLIGGFISGIDKWLNGFSNFNFLNNMATLAERLSEKDGLLSKIKNLKISSSDTDKVKELGNFMSGLAEVTVWETIGDVISALDTAFTNDKTHGGFVEELTTIAQKLPDLLTALHAITFEEGDNQKVADMTAFVKSLTRTEVWTAINDWVTSWRKDEEGETAFQRFGERITEFTTSIVPFFDLMTTYSSSVSDAEKFAQVLQILGRSGALSNFVGEVRAIALSGFTDEEKQILPAISDLVSTMVTWFGELQVATSANGNSELRSLGTQIGANIVSPINESIVANTNALDGTISGVMNTALSNILNGEGNYSSILASIVEMENQIGMNILGGIIAGYNGKGSEISESLYNLLYSGFYELSSYGYRGSQINTMSEVIGKNIVIGIVNGIYSQSQILVDALAEVIEYALDSIDVSVNGGGKEGMRPVVGSGTSYTMPYARGNDGYSVSSDAYTLARLREAENIAANVAGNQTVNGDNITINVYPTPGQSPDDIANSVIEKISARSSRRAMAFGN